MIERLVVTLVLSIVGLVVYRCVNRCLLNRAAQNSVNDPLLDALRPEIPTIVYFTTPMCVPCRTQQKPALTQLRNELGDVTIIEVDATQDPDAASRWGVLSVPTTFILDRNGRPHNINHGVADVRKLRSQIAAVYPALGGLKADAFVG